MTAAAQTLHDLLHVDLIDRTGTHIDLVLELRQYKRCLDAYDIQKFVGCLGSYNGRAFQLLRFTDGDRKEPPVNLGMADDLGSRLIGCHILTQKFSHTGNLGTAATQICRSLKGTHTCLCHKVVGIDQNTGIDTICLV